MCGALKNHKINGMLTAWCYPDYLIVLQGNSVVANNKADKVPSTDAERRAYVNELLKKHTVCGELIISKRATKASTLKNHPTEQCATELKEIPDKTILRTIHEGIEEAARKAVENGVSENIDTALKQYYKAADEVLGFSTLGVKQSFKELLSQTPIVGEYFSPEQFNHGLTCNQLPGPRATKPNLRNVASCMKDDPGTAR